MDKQRTYQSLPSTESVNLDKYWDVVRQLDPEFYLLRIALKETSVNPMILPRIIRALANLAGGTGYGRVVVYMGKGVATSVKTEEADEVNQIVINKFGEKDETF